MYFVVSLHTFLLTTVFKRADDFLILTKCFIDKEQLSLILWWKDFLFQICSKCLLVIFFYFQLAGVKNHVVKGKFTPQRLMQRESFNLSNQKSRCFSKIYFRKYLLSFLTPACAFCQELGTIGNLRDGIFLKTVLAMKS